MKIKISIGSDHAGFNFKELLKDFLLKQNYQVIDKGCFSDELCDYPDYGKAVALSVKNMESQFGIILCGTGIGISVAANKIKGIRAANCTSIEMARLARAHNDANVLALGARILDIETIYGIVRTFLSTEFEGGRHKNRVHKIEQIESENL